MHALNRKLLRDVVHLKGQLIAVMLVCICGIALFVTLRSMHGYLLTSQTSYYRDYRFAHVFAQVVRAPNAVRARLQRLDGVAQVRTRVVAEVPLTVPGLVGPATARLVSIPTQRTPMINDLHLRSGSYPAAGKNEVLISAAFAQANGLRVGAAFSAIINGRRETLRVSGTAISPEFIYEIRTGDIFPDNRRFGVVWMDERTLAAGFDMEGAFNDVVLTLAPGTPEARVLESVDRVLRDFGGAGAYGRADQVSHLFVSSEIEETQVTSILLPTIFLAVTAFLLHIVLSRLVATQREQIGVLKAFGYTSPQIAVHYMSLTLGPVLAGSVAGALIGMRLAHGLAGVYARFYQFPSADYSPDLRVAAVAILIGCAAGLAGALSAALAASRLPAALAMQPETPPRYSLGLLDRFDLQRLPIGVRIVIRNLGRAPLKAALIMVGIGLAAALVLTTRYMFDAIDYMRRVQFDEVHRWDIMVVFDRALGRSVHQELAALPGVQAIELFRGVPVRLTAAARQERVELLGLVPAPVLRRIVDDRMKAWSPPSDGLLITARLAKNLGVSTGDSVNVEVLEGQRLRLRLPVSAQVDELLGVGAYMSSDALRRVLREPPVFSGAFLRVDPAQQDTLYQRLNARPRVAGVSALSSARAAFEETIAESFSISISIAVLFAIVIAFGVVYNGARISLSERARELASLRILGFTRAETARMLLGEQSVLTLLALPLGFAIGLSLCWLITVRFESDLFRIPLVVEAGSFAIAAAIIVVAALASGAAVTRRIYGLDLVAVLKARE